MKASNFLYGALFGLITGILFAPKSGRETRDDIKTAYDEISDRISAELSQTKEVSRETYDRVIESVVTAYQGTKKITRQEADAIKEDLKEGYERIKEIHRKASSKAEPTEN
jgi:gas vesicle protein